MKRFAFLAALAAPAVALALAIAVVSWLEPTAGVSNEITASTDRQMRVP
ncbi:hypothetical protein [Sinorhizobium terangae]|uniref:Uncharacterized protein n=1 Tax=Sinorhizobium terangae TaxID=110322 RepID=A0A6N7LEA8_SINTE|nr:hypothetical protein [Sinorhizobium terangae]MBB4185745.1 hypothetical protein [Sinorhizobium terangae]MQX15548.1 hypothetical protein [Sinorhizobium terangae]WFU46203.1 hypothetical protein QA637_09750 [Sinorhizobium terangae]